MISDLDSGQKRVFVKMLSATFLALLPLTVYQML